MEKKSKYIDRSPKSSWYIFMEMLHLIDGVFGDATFPEYETEFVFRGEWKRKKIFQSSLETQTEACTEWLVQVTDNPVVPETSPLHNAYL